MADVSRRTEASPGVATTTASAFRRASRSISTRPFVKEAVKSKPEATASSELDHTLDFTDVAGSEDPEASPAASIHTVAKRAQRMVDRDGNGSLKERVEELEAQQKLLLDQLRVLLEDKAERDSMKRRYATGSYSHGEYQAFGMEQWTFHEGGNASWEPLISAFSPSGQLSLRTPESLVAPPSPGPHRSPPRTIPASARSTAVATSHGGSLASALDAHAKWRGGSILTTTGSGSISVNMNSSCSHTSSGAHLTATRSPPPLHLKRSYPGSSMIGESTTLAAAAAAAAMSRSLSGRHRQVSLVTVVSPTHSEQSAKGSAEASTAHEGATAGQPPAREPTPPSRPGQTAAPPTVRPPTPSTVPSSRTNCSSSDLLSPLPTATVDIFEPGLHTSSSSSSDSDSDSDSSSDSHSKLMSTGHYHSPHPQRLSSETFSSVSSDEPPDSSTAVRRKKRRLYGSRYVHSSASNAGVSTDSPHTRSRTCARDRASFRRSKQQGKDSLDCLIKECLAPTSLDAASAASHAGLPLTEVKRTSLLSQEENAMDELHRQGSIRSRSHSTLAGEADEETQHQKLRQSKPCLSSPSSPAPMRAAASFAAGMDQSKAIGEVFQEVLTLGHRHSLLEHKFQRLLKSVVEQRDKRRRFQRSALNHTRELYLLYDSLKAKAAYNRRCSAAVEEGDELSLRPPAPHSRASAYRSIDDMASSVAAAVQGAAETTGIVAQDSGSARSRQVEPATSVSPRNESTRDGAGPRHPCPFEALSSTFSDTRVSITMPLILPSCESSYLSPMTLSLAEPPSTVAHDTAAAVADSSAPALLMTPTAIAPITSLITVLPRAIDQGSNPLALSLAVPCMAARTSADASSAGGDAACELSSTPFAMPSSAPTDAPSGSSQERASLHVMESTAKGDGEGSEDVMGKADSGDGALTTPSLPTDTAITVDRPATSRRRGSSAEVVAVAAADDDEGRHLLHPSSAHHAPQPEERKGSVHYKRATEVAGVIAAQAMRRGCCKANSPSRLSPLYPRSTVASRTSSSDASPLSSKRRRPVLAHKAPTVFATVSTPHDTWEPPTRQLSPSLTTCVPLQAPPSSPAAAAVTPPSKSARTCSSNPSSSSTRITSPSPRTSFITSNPTAAVAVLPTCTSHRRRQDRGVSSTTASAAAAADAATPPGNQTTAHESQPSAAGAATVSSRRLYAALRDSKSKGEAL
ncbi:hypothetical protein ABL78_6782 [Leptomonas seymouri]|uniref:Uncharacterized protein n=1 Tax=Leptomonas seymouri TaxID=5684 RepID=A0A0N0P3X4_LEPSE|nr:hypothetical protein ABL78_6782 [Leptomonas seymouri]|eukprot:KPI84157.1 hypothetical protein ABL78_6782 [Leptomonas seymouri]